MNILNNITQYMKDKGEERYDRMVYGISSDPAWYTYGSALFDPTNIYNNKDTTKKYTYRMMRRRKLTNDITMYESFDKIGDMKCCIVTWKNKYLIGHFAEHKIFDTEESHKAYLNYLQVMINDNISKFLKDREEYIRQGLKNRIHIMKENIIDLLTSLEEFKEEGIIECMKLITILTATLSSQPKKGESLVKKFLSLFSPGK